MRAASEHHDPAVGHGGIAVELRVNFLLV